MIDHAAFMIQKDGKTLFVRRSANKKFNPSRWAIPTGTVEAGESVNATATREALEELGVKVEVTELVRVHEVPEFDVRLHFVRCKILEGEPEIQDHDEFDKIEWLTFDELFAKYTDDDLTVTLANVRQDRSLIS